MNQRDDFEAKVEDVIRISEILAVARAIQSGGEPAVGQTIDYFIEPEASGIVKRGLGAPPRKGKPYRTTVEQWHLDGARRMVLTGSVK